jgi:hypothetical protein
MEYFKEKLFYYGLTLMGAVLIYFFYLWAVVRNILLRENPECFDMTLSR